MNDFDEPVTWKTKIQPLPPKATPLDVARRHLREYYPKAGEKGLTYFGVPLLEFSKEDLVAICQFIRLNPPLRMR